MAVSVRLDEDGRLVIADSVTLLASIGRGSYGEVALGVDHTRGDERVAVKCMSKAMLAKAASTSGFGSRSPRAAIAESLGLSVLGPTSRHVVSLYRTIEDPESDDLYYVLELADAGAAMALIDAHAAFSARCGAKSITVDGLVAQDQHQGDDPLTMDEEEAGLADQLGLLANEGQQQQVTVRVFTEEQARAIVQDIATALSVVHAAGFAHRDVSPTNVLLRSSGEAVLCDFGVCSSSHVDITAVAEAAAEGRDLDEAVAAATASKASDGDESTAATAVAPAAPQGKRGRKSVFSRLGFGPETPARSEWDEEPPKPQTKPPPPDSPPPSQGARALTTSSRATTSQAGGNQGGPSPLSPLLVRDMQGPYAFQPPEACGFTPSVTGHAKPAASESSSSSSSASGSKGYDACAADCWMLGCTLCCLLTARQPFGTPGCGPVDQFDAIEAAARAMHAVYATESSDTSGNAEPSIAARALAAAGLTLPSELSPACVDVLGALLHPDCSRRATASDILSHTWFTASGAGSNSAAAVRSLTFEPLDVDTLRPFVSPTVAMLRSEAALHKASADSSCSSSSSSSSGGQVGTVPQSPAARRRRDSTPVPPASLPPPDDALDDAGEAKPLFAGWLQKRGRIRRNWQTRFFLVRDKTLFYFRGAPEPSIPAGGGSSYAQADATATESGFDAIPTADLERQCAGSMDLSAIQDCGRCPVPGRPLRFSVRAGGRELFLSPVGGEAAEASEIVVERWLAGFESLSQE